MIKPMVSANQKAAWVIFRHNKGAMIGLIVLSFILLMALIGPWIAPHDPAHQFNTSILVPPIWNDAGNFQYFFGTDDLGRDMLSRLLYGARLSLIVDENNGSTPILPIAATRHRNCCHYWAGLAECHLCSCYRASTTVCSYYAVFNLRRT